MTKNFYKSNIEHLFDELKKIDLIINLQIFKFRQRKEIFNEFQGLYISEEEIDSIIDLSDKNQSLVENPQIQSLKDYIIDFESKIEENKLSSINHDIELRLESLANLFELSAFEIDVILICLAPALDRKYEKLYAYLNDDITKKHPTIDLVLNSLCYSKIDKINSRKYFDSSKPLFKFHLIDFVGEGTGNMLSRFIKLDERIINYILGVDSIDRRIKSYCGLFKPQENINELIIQDKLKKQIISIIKLCSKEEKKDFTYLLQGRYGAGKKMTAQIICKKLNKDILTVNIKDLMNENVNFEEIIKLIFREALLQDSAIYIEHFELLYSKDLKNPFYRNLIYKNLNEHRGITFIGSIEPISLGAEQNSVFKLDIPTPDFSMREKTWKRYLDKSFTEEDISDISSKFKFTPGQIEDAIESAKSFAAAENNLLKIGHLYNGCKAQSNQKLSKQAKIIELNYKWKDLILPNDKKEQLKELMDYIKNKRIVYQDWGFNQRLSLGKGLNISFSGYSGTGKTMAAEVIANELSLDLYKVDLSMVVSKYIGETEKNLNRIFVAAEESNAIVFFDEADALFGKRSEVRDSHDRYANIEISYLLQKMDENEGIVVLATNLSQNIDEAFLRRMHFTIDFPFPDETSRKKIWQTLIPDKAPVSDDLDFDFLAHNFQLTGGNIKNAIINGAFYAANDSGIINMEHMVKAIKREYQKTGKVCSQSEFGRYYELIN